MGCKAYEVSCFNQFSNNPLVTPNNIKHRNINWDITFQSDDIDYITEKITNCILDAAGKTIPNKIVTVRKGD